MYACVIASCWPGARTHEIPVNQELYEYTHAAPIYRAGLACMSRPIPLLSPRCNEPGRCAVSDRRPGPTAAMYDDAPKRSVTRCERLYGSRERKRRYLSVVGQDIEREITQVCRATSCHAPESGGPHSPACPCIEGILAPGPNMSHRMPGARVTTFVYRSKAAFLRHY